EGRQGWLFTHRALLNDAIRYGIQRAWELFQAHVRLMERIPSARLLAPPITHPVDFYRVPVLSSWARPDTAELDDVDLPGSLPSLLQDTRGSWLAVQRGSLLLLPEAVTQLPRATQPADAAD